MEKPLCNLSHAGFDLGMCQYNRNPQSTRTALVEIINFN